MAASSGGEGRSLAQEFREGEALLAQLERGEVHPQSAEYAELQRRAQGAMLRALKLSQSASLFSRNEELDDVATGDLRFMLCPFLLAKIALCDQAPERRAAALTASSSYLEAFLRVCGDYGVLAAEDRAAMERGDAPLTPEQQRADKIARFKREKELREKIELLSKRREDERRRRKQSEGVEEADEETERELLLATLRSAASQALSTLRANRQEAAMLKEAERARAAAAPAASAGPPVPAHRPKPPTVFHIPRGGVPQRLAVGGAVSVEELMRRHGSGGARAVFRDPNPALLTVEQWQAQQVAKGLMPAPESPRARARRLAEEKERQERAEDGAGGEEREPTEAEQDAETLRQRNWDNWKDEHERGAGNKLAK